MINIVNDLPESLTERLIMAKGMLLSAATEGVRDSGPYQRLRQSLMAEPEIADRLPGLMRTFRDLDGLRAHLQGKSATWQGRREIIEEAFTPMLDELEGINRMPADTGNSTVLSSFDTEGVHAVWTKALDRRQSDPEGAITVARTLLETACKRVLDDRQIAYDDKDDLPKLYGSVAKALKLAPSQHAEDAIKAILGGAMNVVNGIGTLRNKLSDAHGRGGKLPVRPSPRHATLAVNMAGAVAVFIVETHLEQLQK